jgi:hypothetical protein
MVTDSSVSRTSPFDAAPRPTRPVGPRDRRLVVVDVADGQFPTMDRLLEPPAPITLYPASVATEASSTEMFRGAKLAPLAPQSKQPISRPDILAFNSDTGNFYQ